MKTLIRVKIAGLTIPCRLRFPETTAYFSAVLSEDPPCTDTPVFLDDEDWRYFATFGTQPCAYAEFSLSSGRFSDAMIPYGRMAFHACAVRWRDRAYLITGKSGIGKSTQARFLQEIRPGEFSIICGDRPFLEFREKPLQSSSCGPVTEPGGLKISPAPLISIDHSGQDNPVMTATSIDYPAEHINLPTGGMMLPPGMEWSNTEAEIIVHPSPWNGKENWHSAEAAPLGGIILLERGENNRICSVSSREAAVQAFSQIIQTCVNEKTILQSAELATTLLTSVPIWKLTSYSVPDSTRLLADAVFRPD